MWDVFNNFLLIDATDRSKISSDQKRFFIALTLYPLSFFANAPFKEHNFLMKQLKKALYVMLPMHFWMYKLDIKFIFNFFMISMIIFQYVKLWTQFQVNRKGFLCLFKIESHTVPLKFYSLLIMIRKINVYFYLDPDKVFKSTYLSWKTPEALEQFFQNSPYFLKYWNCSFFLKNVKIRFCTSGGYK